MEMVNRYYISYIGGLWLVHHNGDYTRMCSTYRRDYCIRFGMKAELNQFYIARSHYKTRTRRQDFDYKSTSHPVRLNFPGWNTRVVFHSSVGPITTIKRQRKSIQSIVISFFLCVALDMEPDKRNDCTKGTRSAKLIGHARKFIKAEACYVVITVIML